MSCISRKERLEIREQVRRLHGKGYNEEEIARLLDRRVETVRWPFDEFEYCRRFGLPTDYFERGSRGNVVQFPGRVIVSDGGAGGDHPEDAA
jgi:hypothetical protein